MENGSTFSGATIFLVVAPGCLPQVIGSEEAQLKCPLFILMIQISVLFIYFCEPAFPSIFKVVSHCISRLVFAVRGDEPPFSIAR